MTIRSKTLPALAVSAAMIGAMALPATASALVLRNLDTETHQVLVNNGGQLTEVQLAPNGVYRTHGSDVKLGLTTTGRESEDPQQQLNVSAKPQEEWTISNNRLILHSRGMEN